MAIPGNTRIQSIDLRVRDLKSSSNFYSELLGFKEIIYKDNVILLSSNGKYPYLIKLVEDKNANWVMRNTLGLYHVAILLPCRKELARVFLRLFNNKIKFQGFSDHLVSEAIYLSDPDGNGIELYTDKPRDTWKWEYGQVMMETLPLDLSLITNELDDRDVWKGIHHDTKLGHIHLNVSDLDKAEEVYKDVIGFEVTNSIYPGALFLSAGGYHHHIGTNIWFTKNQKLSENYTSGLIRYTISIPDKQYLDSIVFRAKTKNLNVKVEDNNIHLEDHDKNQLTLTL